MEQNKNVFRHPEYPIEMLEEYTEELFLEAIRRADIMDAVGDMPVDRLRELVEADRDGRCHIGRCVECAHYQGLAVCEYLGDCGGTNWICGWFEAKEAALDALKGEQDG